MLSLQADFGFRAHTGSSNGLVFPWPVGQGIVSHARTDGAGVGGRLCLPRLSGVCPLSDT